MVNHAFSRYLPGQFLYCTESYLFSQFLTGNSEYVYLTKPEKTLSRCQVSADIPLEILEDTEKYTHEQIKREYFIPDMQYMYIIRVPDPTEFYLSPQLTTIDSHIESCKINNIIQSASFRDLYSEGEWKTWRHFTKPYGKAKRIPILDNQYGRENEVTVLIEVMYLIFRSQVPLGKEKSFYNNYKNREIYENFKPTKGWRQKI